MDHAKRMTVADYLQWIEQAAAAKHEYQSAIIKAAQTRVGFAEAYNLATPSLRQLYDEAVTDLARAESAAILSRQFIRNSSGAIEPM